MEVNRALDCLPIMGRSRIPCCPRGCLELGCCCLRLHWLFPLKMSATEALACFSVVTGQFSGPLLPEIQGSASVWQFAAVLMKG